MKKLIAAVAVLGLVGCGGPMEEDAALVGSQQQAVNMQNGVPGDPFVPGQPLVRTDENILQPTLPNLNPAQEFQQHFRERTTLVNGGGCEGHPGR